MTQRTKPIGVFDSGVGGLTVYRAMRALMPQEDFIYLGDTARVPYGTKSPEAVRAYAAQAAEALLGEEIKLLVLACNTASAHALETLRAQFPALPILGVVEPGAQAAHAATRCGSIAVLATEGTVRSGAYQRSLLALRPDACIQTLGCSLLVGLAEEGWTEGVEAEAVIARYLRRLDPETYDTLVLGCTHFPLLKNMFRRLLPSSVTIVDSAAATAQAALALLKAQGLEKRDAGLGRDAFWVTDAPERFRRLAQAFLSGQTIGTVTLCPLVSCDSHQKDKIAVNIA